MHNHTITLEIPGNEFFNRALAFESRGEIQSHEQLKKELREYFRLTEKEVEEMKIISFISWKQPGMVGRT